MHAKKGFLNLFAYQLGGSIYASTCPRARKNAILREFAINIFVLIRAFLFFCHPRWYTPSLYSTQFHWQVWWHLMNSLWPWFWFFTVVPCKNALWHFSTSVWFKVFGLHGVDKTFRWTCFHWWEGSTYWQVFWPCSRFSQWPFRYGSSWNAAQWTQNTRTLICLAPTKKFWVFCNK